jgi:hypothetical protein
MSRIESLLSILINVEDKGLGTINKTQAAYKALLSEEAKVQRQRKQFGDETKTLIALQEQFISTIEDAGRKQLETLRNERALEKSRQDQRKSVRDYQIALAQLARETGDLDAAEKHLGQAMHVTNENTEEAIRIQREYARVLDARKRKAAETAADLGKQALAEAAVARAAGNTALEIKLLNQVLKRTDIDSKSLATAQLQLERAMRRQATEAARGRRELERLRREANLARRAVNSITTAYNIFTRALASGVLIGFTIRTIGRTLERFILDPIVEITKGTLGVTDRFRRLDATLLGVVGSMRAVRSLTRDINTAAGGLPVTSQEAISGVRGLAFTPGTAGILQNESPDREEKINNILQILTGLATIDPDQGVEGARFAVREALAGEFRSLRFRFEVSPEVVAATVGANLEDLKADPELTIQALRNFTDTFIGPEAIEQFTELLSVRGNILRGGLEEYFNLIGGEGIYDRVGNIVGNLGQRLTAGVREGDTGVARSAQLINVSLENLLDNLVTILEDVVLRLTGVSVDLSDDFNNLDIEQVSIVVASLVDGLTSLLLVILDITPAIASAVSTVIDLIPGVDSKPFDQAGLEKSIAEESEKRRALNKTLEDYRRTVVGLSAFAELGGNVDGEAGEGTIDARRDLEKFFADKLDKDGFTLGNRRFEDLFSDEAIRDLAEKRIGAYTRGIQEYEDKIEEVNRSIESDLKRLKILDKLSILGDSLVDAGIQSAEPFDMFIKRLRGGSQEIVKSLGNTSLLFDQTARDLPDIQKSTFFSASVDRLGSAIDDLYNPDNTGSLAFVVNRSEQKLAELRVKAQAAFAELSSSAQTQASLALSGQSPIESVRSLVPETASLVAILREIQRIQDAQRATQDGIAESAKNKLLGVVQSSEGFTRQLPPVAQIRQTSDVLGFSGATLPQSVIDILSGQDARRLGQNEPSQFLGQLESASNQIGLSGLDRLDPNLIDTYTRSIDNLGDSVEDYAGDADLGRQVTEDLADQFIELFQALGETAAGEEMRDQINIAIEKLEELKKRGEETATDLEKNFAQVAQAISESFGGGLTDGIVGAFEEGASGARAAMDEMFRSIQKIILRLIIEFTVLRGVVNPILNNSFGLTGQNALPTLGATGMVLGGNGIRPYAQGGIIDRPFSFPTGGGGTGLVGEETPEAVLPLRADASGNIGVINAGGGRGGNTIIFKVYTQDADSFRRSKAQTIRHLKSIGI